MLKVDHPRIAPAQSLRDETMRYLSASSDTFPLDDAENQVRSLVCDTLREYKCLEESAALRGYVREVTRAAWHLVNQVRIKSSKVSIRVDNENLLRFPAKTHIVISILRIILRINRDLLLRAPKIHCIDKFSFPFIFKKQENRIAYDTFQLNLLTILLLAEAAMIIYFIIIMKIRTRVSLEPFF